MAARKSAEYMLERLTKPWNTLKVFESEGELSRLPEHYRKFYWEWKCAPKTPVHYMAQTGNYRRLPTGEVQPVQNVPLPVEKPKEFHQGLWGGEAVIKGFTKKKATIQRMPRYWVPALKKTVVYSEILDRYMRMVVTERTLTLIDQHYGLDNYILQTAPADLGSEMGLRLRRELLLALARETLYPDNPAKRQEMLAKYKEHIIPEEEADWYGLSIKDAIIKQRNLEREANAPKPLKDAFRLEFLEYLEAKKQQEQTKGEETKPVVEEQPQSSWFSRVNPFAKKD